jgi:hypothetical protein
MNRSILIIICDFWILSLLALAKFDVPEATRPTADQTARQAMAAGEKDVVEVLKLALSEEQKRRDTLSSELAATRQNLDQREQTVVARERQLQTLQLSLREKEQLSAQLAQQRTELVEQVAQTQTNATFLRNQLQTASTESLLTQEQLKLLQTQVIRKEEELAGARRRVEELDRQRESAQMEKARLSAQLQVVETEKRMVTQQAGHLSNEVQVVRAEKTVLQEHATALQQHATKLAAGVDTLAEKSSALTQEIRDNREIAANAIFAELATNRVTLRFVARRKGLFGIPVQHDKEAQTLLISQTNQYFALCHISDTPLTFSTPGFGYDMFQVSLEHGLATVPVTKLQFLSIDPRLLVIPLSEADAHKLGTKIYRLAAEPNKFTEAVLVGPTEGYYGECRFQIDLSAPLYVRMDRAVFRIFSSKFNPSRGDLVLSKTGELLGMMANNQYCAVLNRLHPVAEIVPAAETSASAMGKLLSEFDRGLQQLPMKLQ